MIEDPAVLSREALERYRFKALAAGDLRDLRLTEDLVEFLQTEVVATHPPGEYLGAVFVDEMAQALGTSVPYLGYLGRLRVEPRTFLAPGVMIGAAGLLLFHHRPGDEPRPTRRDIQVARFMLKAGDTTGLRLLDYLVLSGSDWTSLQEAGPVRFLPLGETPLIDGRAEVKPKYRDPQRPNLTWSGRGKMARWLKRRLADGGKLADFVVEE